MAASVMLVHGAFHGAWCWSRVLEGLRARDIEAHALDLPGHGASREPLGDLAQDAAALRRALRDLRAPVVVCGHSFGGAVISEGVDPGGPVSHLVYLAAVIPDRGQSVMESLPASVTPELAASLLRDEAGGLVVDPAQREQVFYHDCEPQLARWAAAQLGPEHPAAMTTRLTRAAWRSIASTYVVCLADRTIPAAAQEELARRCTHVERFDTSHSPMLSRPELLVELLARLAR